VRAFYAAEPLSNERTNILQSLIAVENARPEFAKQIDLRAIPERTARITAEFKKHTRPGYIVSAMHDRDAERRQMMDILLVRKDVRGAARAVVQDRFDTIGLQELAVVSYIPRNWGGAKQRRAERSNRLMLEALAFNAR
jgi:hypothetical protein